MRTALACAGWLVYACAVAAILVAAWRQAGRADEELRSRRNEWPS